MSFRLPDTTDAIIICGTTGEASTLSDEEHLECIRFTCGESKQKEFRSLQEPVQTAQSPLYIFQKKQKKHGVDGLLLVTPYYNKATQNGLKAHYKAIAISSKSSDHSLQCTKP